MMLGEVTETRMGEIPTVLRPRSGMPGYGPYPRDACLLMGRERAHTGPNYVRGQQDKSGSKARWEIPVLLRGMRALPHCEGLRKLFVGDGFDSSKDDRQKERRWSKCLNHCLPSSELPRISQGKNLSGRIMADEMKQKEQKIVQNQ